MSDDLEEEIKDRLDTLNTLSTLIKMLIVGAFAVGSWVATLEWRARSIGEHDKKIEEIQFWKERTEANRFDMRDGITLQTALTELTNSQDRRIQKLESTTETITKSLERIESKLGTKN